MPCAISNLNKQGETTLEKLCYQTLASQNYEGYLLPQAPERVLQFGEGNFLRAFVDYFVDIANERCGFNTKVVVCQPIPTGMTERINEQEGLYTLCLRGREDGNEVNDWRVISSVSRCINPYENYDALLECAKNEDLRYIVSNTTEAGIAYDPSCGFDDRPPASFPAKLTRFLYERFSLGGRGFVILSCELIDNNGRQLLECVRRYIAQWNLPQAFADWVEKENLFCSTLVDRIVTGYPRAEAEALCSRLGYEDALLDTGEPFGLWVIEGPQELEEELPFARAGLPVKVVADHTPYKKRKVRILNGAHTCMIPTALLCGQTIVRECMEDPEILAFLRRAVYDEIIPTLTLPKDELLAFAHAVEERFANPFIDHQLVSILLNNTSKWKARVLPSLRAYLEKKSELPACLTLSFAAYLECYVTRDVQDDPWVLDFFAAHRDDAPRALASAALSNERMWDEDLSALPGLLDAVTADLEEIRAKGMRAVMNRAAGRN